MNTRKLCGHCREPFELSRGAHSKRSKRSDAKFCSLECRKTAYRRRLGVPPARFGVRVRTSSLRFSAQ